MPDNKPTPHGGKLIDLLVSKDKRASLIKQSTKWHDLELTQRQLCDLELLLNGGFSPLTTFMGEADYKRVLGDMRLKSGELWPMPITLDVDEEFAKSLKKNEKIALRDHEGVMLAVITVSETYKPDKV